eukprot:scaffold230583_cov65-Attheya_sp.AAC.1
MGVTNVRGNSAALKEMARNKGINLKATEPKIIEGWYGKAKGMKQIAYERRLLDIDNLNLYSIDGPKDDENNELDISFSYKKILGSLTDFMEEKTLLQTVGEEIGKERGINIIIDRSPKCHPEVAGEGIEYTWA